MVQFYIFDELFPGEKYFVSLAKDHFFPLTTTTALTDNSDTHALSNKISISISLFCFNAAAADSSAAAAAVACALQRSCARPRQARVHGAQSNPAPVSFSSAVRPSFCLRALRVHLSRLCRVQQRQRPRLRLRRAGVHFHCIAHQACTVRNLVPDNLDLVRLLNQLLS